MQLSRKFLVHAFLAASFPSPPNCYEVMFISEDESICSVSAKISVHMVKLSVKNSLHWSFAINSLNRCNMMVFAVCVSRTTSISHH